MATARSAWPKMLPDRLCGRAQSTIAMLAKLQVDAAIAAIEAATATPLGWPVMSPTGWSRATVRCRRDVWRPGHSCRQRRAQRLKPIAKVTEDEFDALMVVWRTAAGYGIDGEVHEVSFNGKLSAAP